MGAPSVTPQEIVQMHRLYVQLGTYAAVAREMGRSASTVSKYVQMFSDMPNIAETVIAGNTKHTVPR